MLMLSLASAGVFAAGNDAPVMQVLRAIPASESQALGGAAASVAAPPDAYRVRTGAVALQTDAFLPATSSAVRGLASSASFSSQTLALELFPDTYVEVEVSSESHPAPDVVSLNGRVPGSALSTFAMTVTPDGYLMTFDDPAQPYRYRVVGDSATGVGQVTEYDLRNAPPVLYAPPLVPPVER